MGAMGILLIIRRHPHRMGDFILSGEAATFAKTTQWTNQI
jgi:hypothetical protein